MPQSGTLANGWYYRLLGEEFGPVSKELLDGLIAEGQLGSGDEVRDGDAGTWQLVSQLATTAKTAHNGHAMDGTSFSLESLSDAGLDELETVSESTASPPATQERWYYQSFGQDWGPFSFAELLEHVRQGDIGADDLIRLGDRGKWRRAGSMGRLAAVMPYSLREAKTIPTGKKPAESEEEDDLEIRVPLRSPPAEVQKSEPPAPAAAPPPPPPPPPPPMMPVAGYPGYAPAYVQQPMAPAWGYSQPAAPVNDQGWYAWLGGVECGPMDYAQFANWATTGRIQENDYVKQGRYSQWTLAKTVPGLVTPAAPVPPPPKPVPAAAAPVAAAAPAVAPATKAAVQLPPPRPKGTELPAQAASTTPASTGSPTTSPAAAPSSSPEPRYDPPPRPPGTDWGSSSVMSSYRPGMNLNPSAKKPAPASRSKKKSSGGGEIDVGALLQDKRVLGGLGAVLLAVGIWLGIGLLPEGTGALKAAHKDITALHKEVLGMADKMPTGKEQIDYVKKLKEKTKKIRASFVKSKLTQLKSPLTQALSKIESAANKQKPDEVKTALEDAGKKLKDAAKKLGI